MHNDQINHAKKRTMMMMHESNEITCFNWITNLILQANLAQNYSQLDPNKPKPRREKIEREYQEREGLEREGRGERKKRERGRPP